MTFVVTVLAGLVVLLIVAMLILINKLNNYWKEINDRLMAREDNMLQMVVPIKAAEMLNEKFTKQST